MSEASISKKCPKCGEVDVTSFSKCRRCGTSYNFKKAEKEKEFSFIPIILFVAVVVIGVSAYQYLQMNSLYKRPEQLIGRTLVCNGSVLFASSQKANLLSLDPKDFKLLNHTGASNGPTTSDAGALNHLAGMSDEISVLEKYMNDSRFTMIQREGNDPPFSVKVVAASAPDDKFPLVQVNA